MDNLIIETPYLIQGFVPATKIPPVYRLLDIDLESYIHSFKESLSGFDENYEPDLSDDKIQQIINEHLGDQASSVEIVRFVLKNTHLFYLPKSNQTGKEFEEQIFQIFQSLDVEVYKHSFSVIYNDEKYIPDFVLRLKSGMLVFVEVNIFNSATSRIQGTYNKFKRHHQVLRSFLWISAGKAWVENLRLGRSNTFTHSVETIPVTTVDFLDSVIQKLEEFSSQIQDRLTLSMIPTLTSSQIQYCLSHSGG